MLIEVMSLLGKAYLGSEMFGSSADEFLMCAAIYVGQAEGKPMNASKLSTFVGMPRATLLRKISRMQDLGFIERKSSGAYVLPIAALNSRNVITVLPAVFQCIVDTAHQLSGMDSGAVVRRTSE